jgi:acetyl-CoA C-acetyltransferase
VNVASGRRDVVVAGAVRTPIGRFGGALAALTASDLGAIAAREALRRAGLPASAVDETVFGCARQAGLGPNVARQVSIRAGVPQERPAFTVNMACASGLKALDLAYRAVRDGDADVVLVGGTESMSRVPYLLTEARWGHKMGDHAVTDAMYQDGFLCPLAQQLMGETAETLASMYKVTRTEQDAFALESQTRAARAAAGGAFDAEIVPVDVPAKGASVRVAKDEHPRETSIESLSRLPPVFGNEGTVTAGNASGITDGAAAMVVLSEERAEGASVDPLARIVATSAAGVDPKLMGLGVVPAVRALEERGHALERFDLVEINEAFAAQVLACDRELHVDRARLNVNGGAIALGHPIGATGARIVVTLLHAMRASNARRGLASLCVSGGMGMAAAFERGQR